MNYVHPPNKQLIHEQVWAFVRQIPSGKVATYGQVSKTLSKPEGVSKEDFQLSAARWVGLAMAACPNDVPWHRVVNSQGKISKGTDPGKQKLLLEAEEILFSNGKLSLAEFQWKESGQDDEPSQGRLF